MEHTVLHEPDERRFVVRELGHEAYLSYYELPNRTLDFSHTFTPSEIRGRGVSTAVIRYALEYARDNGYRVVPACPFVRTYIDRHQQFADLVAERPAGV